jgi:hypothetical protein
MLRRQGESIAADSAGTKVECSSSRSPRGLHPEGLADLREEIVETERVRPDEWNDAALNRRRLDDGDNRLDQVIEMDACESAGASEIDLHPYVM